MALTKLTTDLDNIQALDDLPNDEGGLSATDLKETFDKAGNDIKTYINDTLTGELDTKFTDVEGSGRTTETIKGNADNLTTHKSSSDHDSRYYTETELNNGQLNELYLNKTNTSEFTPTSNYQPSTKKYVDDTVAGVILGQVPDNSLTTEKMATEQKRGVANGVASLDSNGQVPSSQLSGIYNKVYENEKALTELLLQADIDSKVVSPNLGKFYADGEHTFNYSLGTIDTTKAYCDTVTQGTDNVDVTDMVSGSITDFEVAQEVTLQDDTNKETLIISDISDPTITFTSNIVNTYSAGANVYRSNIDTSNGDIRFGGYTSQVTYDVSTPTTVVASAYDTSGNGGRKLVRLSNGWLVACAFQGSEGTGQSNVYKSEDNGETWSRLCYDSKARYYGCSLVSSGTSMTIFYKTSDAGVKSNTFSATTQTDVDIEASGVNVDTGQSSVSSYVSIEVDSNGHLHAAWASKNATYPNSFNLRYSKSTDGGATWATPTQLTTDNNSGLQNTYPCVVITSGNPIIIWTYGDTTASGRYYIKSKKYNGSSWDSNVTIYDSAGNYAQSNPSAVVSPDGTIHVAWQGKDATYTSAPQIFYSYSVDVGSTWQTAQRLTAVGNNQLSPSVSCRQDNRIFIMYYDQYAGRFKYKYSDDKTNFTTVDTGLSGLNNGADAPSSIEYLQNFTAPPTIWKTSTDVKFYGVFTATGETAITDIDLRMNIVPFQDVSNISAWVYHNDLITSIDGKASIVGTSDNESYTDLTETTMDVNTNKETISIGSVATPDNKVTLKYTLSRNSTSDVAIATKILGGVD